MMLTIRSEEGHDGLIIAGFLKKSFTNHSYYQRFGFKAAEPLYYNGVESKYFMALTFNNHLAPSGEVKFHPAFAQLAEH